MMIDYTCEETMFENAFNYSAIGMALVASDGRFLKVNGSLCNILGYPEEELLNMTFQEITHPDYLEIDLAYVRQMLNGEIRYYEMEKRYFHKQGNAVWVLLSVSLVRDELGVPLYFISQIQNISERKRVEEELKNEKDKLESIVNGSADAIAIQSVDGYILQVNPAFEKMYGWCSEELVGKRPPFIPESHREEYRHCFEKIKSGDPIMGFETVRQRKDGTLFNASLTVSPIRDASGHISMIVGTIKDITKIKQAEDMLRRSDKLNIAGQLAAGVAHEIRNPLTTVKGFVQLLHKKFSSGPQETFRLILSEINHIETIISEFLFLAKPSAVHYDFRSLNDLICDIESLLETQAILNNINIITEYEAKLPLIPCDANQLKHVFINVVKNAIEFMPKGGDVRIRTGYTSSSVWVKVVDHGCGIPSDRLKKLGEPFYTTKERGTGFGLMVSYKIVEEHKGEIHIHSEVGKGTEVEVVFPWGLKS